jgi:16S rRNA (guanine966-N2)-methyltransferase
MLRIIAGRYRGRRLYTPPGLQVRPTADRVKACIFDVLQDVLEGARVADLYAGTGNLGFEALSRGARQVVLVERERTALEALRRNLAALGVEGEVEVVRGDALRYLAGPHPEPFDLVLADPPYAAGLGADLLAVAGAALRPRGWFVLQQACRAAVTAAPAGLRVWRPRRFGDTRIDFFCREEDGLDASGAPDGALPGDV